MSQRATIARLDAELHAAFVTAGFADSASYKAGADAPIACRVYVDRDMQVRGEFGQVIGRRTEIAILRADIASPAKGAQVTVDGEVFVLVEQTEDSDSSLSRWVVRDA